MMSTLLWTVGAFLLGALPFSALIARYALGLSIRTVGDGNPGATNVGKAGGVKWAVLAFILDYLKGALPAGMAWFFFGFTDWQIIPIAVAPIAGHAFSPFLGFKGGKALAATFGIWSGLTLAEIPVILGLHMLLFFKVIKVDGWAVMLALGMIGLYTAFIRPNPLWFGVWLGNFLILAYKHRKELSQPLRLKPIFSRVR